MQVLIIKNYKRKIISSILLMCLWITMISLTDFFSSNSTLLSVTIKDINFSYPVNLKIDNIVLNQNYDKDDVKAVGFFSSPQIDILKRIEAKGLGFSFSFPSAFQITEQSFVGNEILYHVDFSNKSKEIYGFVQVWKLETPLKDFLINSKNTSLSNFKNFKMNEININGMDGYLWDYTSVSDTKSIKALEAFLQKDGKMYRVSYFLPEKLYSKEQEETFMNILKSIKID